MDYVEGDLGRVDGGRPDRDGSHQSTDRLASGRLRPLTIRRSSERCSRKEERGGGKLKSIVEPQRETPVLTKVDVVVAGGGPSGFAAAVAARRNGTEVLMVDRNNYIGGLLTSLPMNAFYNYRGEQVIKGIPDELVQRLVQKGASSGHQVDPRLGSSTATDSEMVKVVTQEMCEEAGVKLLFHTFIVGPILEDSTIKGIIVENKSGRQAILGNIVIDSTGDGDIAVRSGVPFEIKERKAIQPGTLMFKMDNVNVDKIRLAVAENPDNARTVPGHGPGAEFFLTAERFILDGFVKEINEAQKNGDLPEDYPQSWLIIICNPREDEVWINNAMVVNFHSTDAFDLTRAEMLGRERIPIVVNFLKKYIPGFADAKLTHSHGIIGVRESRRIIGDYMLTAEDIMENRTFDDGIMVTPWRPATGHNPDGKFADDTYPKEGLKGCELPYRCLLPKKIENLLIAGRCVSTSGLAQNAIRNMPPCMAIGQAAGTAAAIAVKEGISSREVDPSKLRTILVEQGAFLLSYKR